MFHNVVVGKPIVNVSSLLAIDERDWEENEKKNTLFTETRFLPTIMKEAGIGYGAINHPVDRDPVCGYVGIIKDVCPKCGRREGEAVSLEKITMSQCDCK